MNCPICEDERFESVWTHGSGIANGICLNCGHVYLTGFSSSEAISKYADFAQSYDDDFLLNPSTPLFTLARTRKEVLRQWKPDLSAVVEIGSGYGHFLHILGHGVDRIGLEPSTAGVRFAQQQFGLDAIKAGSLERVGCDWPGRKVDAICSFHVLEHLQNPYTFLEFVRTRLADSGVLMLAVPELGTLNPDLIELYFLFRAWHIHTFSKNSIYRLLARSGFEVMQVINEPVNTMLRSSILIIARPRDGQDIVEPPPNVDAARQALHCFHTRLDTGLEALRQRIDAWHTSGMRVAIYGGGMHTRALFELAGLKLSAITCVIDDDPAKAGDEILGIPIKSFADTIAAAPDVILISTLASEDALLERLPNNLPSGIQLFGIYRHFFE